MEAFCSGVNKVSRWGSRSFSRSFVPSCRPPTLTSRQSALHLGSLFVWFTTSQIHLKAIVLLWRIPRPPLLPHSRLWTAHTHKHTFLHSRRLLYLSLTHPLAQSLSTHTHTHTHTHTYTHTHTHTHSAHLSWSDAGGDCYPGNRINPQIPDTGWSRSELRWRERKREEWWRRGEGTEIKKTK